MRWILLLLVACGGKDDGGDTANVTDTDTDTDADTDTDTDADADTDTEHFELNGYWVYSGAGNSFDASLEFTDTTMEEHDLESAAFSSYWTVLQYDNDVDRAEARLDSFDGSYPYPVGTVMYTSYRLDGDTIDLYYSQGSYPDPTGGTEGVDYFEYTRSTPP